ncbi:PH domain-containing protein [Salinispora arenicola]|uniref:PH (Pleckstrin Homology) domain-containing protein n=2 Tax=Salinispora arenicola TaxID=168697 RepID=A0A542XTP8_SALAC|nr:PH domain-containing protein [Salinispora arenicola]MCN0153637.1 PH domain-containing protein [Salinispora arenicola]MCN0180558.1 PH domain-containing protein [Salinispora arenicola]NIL43369.1 PH domain-containing protein [Salinispora arenicola]NIL58132.1 PH domain-containing protein [Salinispora arenicola]NIL61228.1 PH domain-containing protein [Salinispora arenicola]
MVSKPEAVRIRPRRARLVCWASAIALVLLFTVLATSLHGATGSGYGTFQRGDQLAMVGLGVLGALAFLLFARPKVEADAQRVRVQNVIGSYQLPWEVVRGVRFDRGAPWASLELHDDDLVPMLALQAADKELAVDGVRELRRLHQAHLAQGVAGR